MRDIESLRKLAGHLLSIRSRREPAWLELSRWISGTPGAFENQADAIEDNDIMLFRASIAQALSRGASGMTSGMTPRNVSWFTPAFSERAMEEASGAREWLDVLDRRMKDALALGGFYQAIQQFNTDLLWAGCALIFCEEPMRFECQQTGSWAVGLDIEKKPKTVLRSLRMSPAQALDVFGTVPDSVMRLAENEPYRELQVWHLVEQTETVESVWWLDSGEILRRSMYNEMPFFFTVWSEGATPYGTGPGDEALADARQIDKMERFKLAGLAKLVDPPMAAPYSMKGSLDLAPGAINYIAGNEECRPLIDLAPFAQAMRFLQEEIRNVAARAENSLKASIFASMPLDQRPANMSATEFLERKREALQELGPVISAYEPNVLTPLLHRVAAILDRQGLTPPLPDALADMPVMMRIEFLSPMANALRQTGAEATRAMLQDAGAIFQMTQNAEIFDKLDTDQAIDELARGIGAPGSIIRSDADVAQIRQERAEKAGQMEQMQQMQQGLSMAGQMQGMDLNERKMKLAEGQTNDRSAG